MTHEFKPYADNPDYCVAELADSGDTCNRPREAHLSHLREVLASFQKASDRKWAYINAQTNGGEDDPADGFSEYDEAVADYNEELAELGEALAEALAESELLP